MNGVGVAGDGGGGGCGNDIVVAVLCLRYPTQAVRFWSSYCDIHTKTFRQAHWTGLFKSRIKITVTQSYVCWTSYNLFENSFCGTHMEKCIRKTNWNNHGKVEKKSNTPKGN